MKQHSKILFHSITVEGFGTIQKPIEFRLDRFGLNMIYGENGHGKTTLFSALTWALYGTPLKSIKKDDVSTWKRFRLPSFKGTRVLVELHVDDVPFTVARHLKYKGKTYGMEGKDNVLVFKEGQLVTETQHNSQAQEYIRNLLGLEPRAFMNSIVFGQRMKRLVEADNKDKRALFEELFEADFIDGMKAKFMEQANSLSQSVQANTSKGQLLEQQINATAEALATERRLIAEFESDKKARLVSLQAELEQNATEGKAIKEDLEKTNTLLSTAEEKHQGLSGSLDGFAEAIYKEDVQVFVNNAYAQAASLRASKEEHQKVLANITLGEQPDMTAIKAVKDKAEQALTEYKSNYETYGSYLTRSEQQKQHATDKINAGQKLIAEYKQQRDAEGTCKFCDKQFPTEFLTPILEKWDLKIAAEQKAIAKEEAVVVEMTLAIEQYSTQLEEYTEERTAELKAQLETAENGMLKFADELSNYHARARSIDTAKANIESLENQALALVNTANAQAAIEKPDEFYVLGSFSSGFHSSKLSTLLADYTAADKALNDAAEEVTSLQRTSELLVKELETKRSLYRLVKAQFDEKSEEKRKGLDVDATEARLSVMTKEKEDLLIRTEELTQEQQRVEWWLKNAFSASGLKAYIFEAMLGYLNQCVEKYASRLGLSVQFGIDMTKASKPFKTTCYKGLDAINYEALSGGEKQKVDIVLAFAVHELVSSMQDISLLVMDEVFEGLSKANIEIVFDLIRLKAEHKAVFVVTHSDTIDSRNTKAIYVVKDAATENTTIDG